jgi:hypothetical protein
VHRKALGACNGARSESNWLPCRLKRRTFNASLACNTRKVTHRGLASPCAVTQLQIVPLIGDSGQLLPYLLKQV